MDNIMDFTVKEFKKKFSEKLGNKIDSECAYYGKYSNSFRKILELVTQMEIWKKNNNN